MSFHSDESERNNELFTIIEDPGSSRADKIAAFRSFALQVVSVGSCGICGGDLKYEGTVDGLFITCVLNSSHTWKTTAEFAGSA
jgi:hypothetical protein